MKHRDLYQALLIAVLVASGLSFNACSPETVQAQSAPAEVSLATVATPVVRDVAVTQSFPAQVEAVERVELRPQVSGYLDAVTFAEGTFVSRGQVLFRIDPRPFASAVAEAEAALAQATVDAEAAEKESERAARLTLRKAVSEEDADRRQAAAGMAAARVTAARAALERAKLNLSFTEVRSPISGRIGRAEVTRGNLVSPQTRLAVVVATDPVYVRFDVDESTLAAQLGSGTSHWRVAFQPQGAAAAVPARVAFVENEISGGTGTLRIRARLPNAKGGVIPGMYGTATLIFGEQKGATLVREEAIGTSQGQRYVLVADAKNVLQYRAVTLGRREGGLRVVSSGIQAGDRIVVSGLFRLRPGMPVAPTVVPMEKEG